MRSILVTRPQPVADEFAERLRHEGFLPYVAPMSEYIDLDADLSDLNKYQALLFTSVQAVQSFVRRSDDRHCAVLAVGDVTARAAEETGFSKVYSAQGDSEDVVELIKQNANDLSFKKILHLCSDDTPEDIAKKAARFGVDVVQCQIYKAALVTKLPDDVVEALREHKIDIITLFSARTAANIVQLMQRRGVANVCARMEAVCLSERVAEEVKDLNWRAVRIANRPDMASMLDLLKIYSGAAVASNRRQGLDRRQSEVVRDANGYIETPSYKGNDRRSGIDRREFERLKRERVMLERKRIAKRTFITFSLMALLIVAVVGFLLVPEYKEWRNDTSAVASVAGTAKDVSWSDKFKSFFNYTLSSSSKITSNVREDFSEGFTQGFANTLARVDTLRRNSVDAAQVEQSLQLLRRVLAASPRNPEEMNAALMEARKQNKVLDSLLGSTITKDLAAAALLLSLSEFRSNVGGQRPYAEDLAMLKNFVGNDPEMLIALQRLSPYAERGIMGREALLREFNGFAKDIVMAQVPGQDVSLKQQALARFNRLSNVLRIEDLKGQSTEEVVARARLRLRQGDVDGAMRELQQLESASAAVAEPWMSNAATYVLADESSDVLTRGAVRGMQTGSNIPIEEIISLINRNIRGSAAPYVSPGARGGSRHRGYGGVIAP